MGNTKIEWAMKSWNPLTGCTPITAGCRNCYAMRMAKRLAGRYGYPAAPHEFDVTFHPERLEEPLRWRKPQRVFVCSMGDFYHEDVPLAWQIETLEVIKKCPQHTFIFLTKRPYLMGMIEFISPDLYMPNVWLGVSISNQDDADKFIPDLLAMPAAVVRFVSYEPALAAVDMIQDLIGWLYCERCGSIVAPMPCELRCPKCDYLGVSARRIDFVIAGCETGPGARPAERDWFRDVALQCKDADVPFFLKAVAPRDHTGLLDGELCRAWPG